MDLIVSGRIGGTLPGLAEGIRRSSAGEDPAVSRSLLRRLDQAAPAPDGVVRLRSVHMAGAGEVRLPPPAPRSSPPPGQDRASGLASRARRIGEAIGSEAGPGLERLGRALDLLVTSRQEQQELVRRSLRELR